MSQLEQLVKEVEDYSGHDPKKFNELYQTLEARLDQKFNENDKALIILISLVDNLFNKRSNILQQQKRARENTNLAQATQREALEKDVLLDESEIQPAPQPSADMRGMPQKAFEQLRQHQKKTTLSEEITPADKAIQADQALKDLKQQRDEIEKKIQEKEEKKEKEKKGPSKRS